MACVRTFVKSITYDTISYSYYTKLYHIDVYGYQGTIVCYLNDLRRIGNYTIHLYMILFVDINLMRYDVLSSFSIFNQILF